MLYDYLINNYSENEPIFESDIDLPVSGANLRQTLKNLCDDGKIRRFDRGVYYIPAKTRLKGASPVVTELVAECKYVTRKGNVDGYYSGFTFANQMGVTVRIPYTLEIVSNAASANVRQLELKGRRILLRKPKTTVTRQNYRILQFLDLLKDIDIYADEVNEDTSVRLAGYIRDESMKQTDLDEYLPLYPDKTYRNIYNMRLYNAFAS